MHGFYLMKSCNYLLVVIRDTAFSIKHNQEIKMQFYVLNAPI